MNLNINIEELKEKQELVSVILLGGAAILVILTVIVITKFFLLSTETENIILNAIKQSKRTDADIKQVYADTKALADSLSTNNLFAPATFEFTQDDEPEEETVIFENPVQSGGVTAILDNMAYINGSWYSPGDRIMGSGGSARIVAIKGDYVTIEYNNQTENFYPIDATTKVSEVSSNNDPMSSMMGGAISINGNDITIDRSAIRDMMSRMFDGGGPGGMMGGFGGGMEMDMMGRRGRGSGRGGFGGF